MHKQRVPIKRSKSNSKIVLQSIMRKLLPLLVVLLLGSDLFAQLHHFPQYHEGIFTFNSGPKLELVRLYYDSTPSSPSSTMPLGTTKLWHAHFKRCKTFPESMIAPFSELNLYYDFWMDSAFLKVFLFGIGKERRFPLDMQPGEWAEQADGSFLIYEKDDWYDDGMIADSAAWFYPYVNGHADLSQEPYILGKNVGWIRMGADPFRQLCTTQNGLPPEFTLSWQDFYPARAGDVLVYSIWQYRGPDQPADKEVRVDSILQAEFYADSVVYTLRSRSRTEDFVWSDATLVSRVDKPLPGLVHSASSAQFGNRWVMTDSTNGDIMYDAALYEYEPATGTVSLSMDLIGYRGTLLSCHISSPTDIMRNEYWNTRYGYLDESGNGSRKETLVAANVQGNKFGTINLVGLKSPGQAELRVFPNPSRSTLHIYGAPDGSVFQVYNLQGQALLAGVIESESQIAIQELEPGIYTLVLSTGNGPYNTRFQVIR